MLCQIIIDPFVLYNKASNKLKVYIDQFINVCSKLNIDKIILDFLFYHFLSTKTLSD